MSENVAAESAPIENAAVESAEVTETVKSPIEQSMEEAAEVPAESGEVQAETAEEFTEEVNDAIENGASAEEVKQMIKEFELKVNGKTIKKRVDLSNEEEITRILQREHAGQLAMQRAKELEKEYKRGIEELTKDPFSVLKELGLDPDELSEKHIESKIEEMKKSPEQREREQLQRDLEDARAKLKEQEDAAKEAKFQQLQEQEAAKLETEIQDALDGHKTLPKSQKTVARIADAMLWAMENGFEEVSVADVVPVVEEEIRQELAEFYDNMPDELLENYFSKKHMDRLRKRRIAENSPKNLNNVKSTSSSVTEKKKEPKQKIKASEFFKNLGRDV